MRSASYLQHAASVGVWPLPQSALLGRPQPLVHRHGDRKPRKAGSMQRCAVSAVERIKASLWRTRSPGPASSPSHAPLHDTDSPQGASTTQEPTSAHLQPSSQPRSHSASPSPPHPGLQRTPSTNTAAKAPSRSRKANSVPLTPEELEQKEAERRARISAANSGKVPWNKGRKHSAETIAKIRETTRAAMARPDVVNAYKEGVAKHLEKKAEERKLHPPPIQQPVASPKAPRVRIPRSIAALAAERDEVPMDGSSCWDSQQARSRGGGGAVGSARRAMQRLAAAGSSALASPPEGWHPDGPEGIVPPAPRRATRAKSGAASGSASGSGSAAGGVQGEGTEPAPRRTRRPTSEAHKAAIAAAIRAKWQDPEYRSRTISGIHNHVQALTGRDPAVQGPVRPRSTPARDPQPSATQRKPQPEGDGGDGGGQVAASSGRRRGVRSSNGTSEAVLRERQVREERLAQIEALVSQVLNTRKLIARMDMNVEAMRVKAAAFQNDPHMTARAHEQVCAAESVLATARTRLAQMHQQIPPGVTFDSSGRVSVADPSVLSAAPRPSNPPVVVGQPQQQQPREVPVARPSPQSLDQLTVVQPSLPSAKGRTVVQPSSLLSHLDPEAMRDPLHAVPYLQGMGTPPHANGHGTPHANGHHANGYHANGHTGAHANGHSAAPAPHANGHSQHGGTANGRAAQPYVNGHASHGGSPRLFSDVSAAVLLHGIGPLNGHVSTHTPPASNQSPSTIHQQPGRLLDEDCLSPSMNGVSVSGDTQAASATVSPVALSVVTADDGCNNSTAAAPVVGTRRRAGRSKSAGGGVSTAQRVVEDSQDGAGTGQEEGNEELIRSTRTRSSRRR